MSLYAEYLKEVRDDGIVENDEGFATYRYLNEEKTVYIVDIYIKPECRKSGAASAIADDIVRIAKEVGCTELLGTVVPSNRNSTASLKVLLGSGMALVSATNDFIVI